MAASVCTEPSVASSNYFLRGQLSSQQDNYDLTSLANLYPRAAQVLEAKMRRAESASSLASTPLISSPSLGSLRTSGSRQTQRHPSMKDTRVSFYSDYMEEQQHVLRVDDQEYDFHATILSQKPSGSSDWKPRAGERARCALVDRGRQAVPQFIDFASCTATSSTAPPPQVHSNGELVIQNGTDDASVAHMSSTKGMAFSDERSGHAVSMVMGASSNHSNAALGKRAASEPQLQLADRCTADVERCCGSGMMGKLQHSGSAPCPGVDDATCVDLPEQAPGGDASFLRESCGGREAGGTWDPICGALRIADRDGNFAGRRPSVDEASVSSPCSGLPIQGTAQVGFEDHSAVGLVDSGLLVRGAASRSDNVQTVDEAKGRWEQVYGEVHPAFGDSQDQVDHSGTDPSRGEMCIRIKKEASSSGPVHGAFAAPAGEADGSFRRSYVGSEHTGERYLANDSATDGNRCLVGSNVIRSSPTVGEQGPHAGSEKCEAIDPTHFDSFMQHREADDNTEFDRHVGGKPVERLDQARSNVRMQTKGKGGPTHCDSFTQPREADNNTEFDRHVGGEPFGRLDQRHSNLRIRTAGKGTPTRCDSFMQPRQADDNTAFDRHVGGEPFERLYQVQSNLHVQTEGKGGPTHCDSLMQPRQADDNTEVDRHVGGEPFGRLDQVHSNLRMRTEGKGSSAHCDSFTQPRQADDNHEFDRHVSGEPFGRLDQVHSNLRMRTEGKGGPTHCGSLMQPRQADDNTEFDRHVGGEPFGQFHQVHSNLRMQTEEEGSPTGRDELMPMHSGSCSHDSSTTGHSNQADGTRLFRQTDGNAALNEYFVGATLPRPHQMYGNLHEPSQEKGSPVGGEGTCSAPYGSRNVDLREPVAGNREHVHVHTPDSTLHTQPVTPAFGNFSLESPLGESLQGADGNRTRIHICNAVCVGDDAMCGNLSEQIGERGTTSLRKGGGVNVRNAVDEGVDATYGVLPEQVAEGDGKFLRESCVGSAAAGARDPMCGALRIGDPDASFAGMRPTVEEASGSSSRFGLPIHETAHDDFHDYSAVGFIDSGLPVRGVASHADRNGWTVDGARGTWEPAYGEVHPAFGDPQDQVDHSGRDSYGGEQYNSMRMPLREESRGNCPTYGLLPAPVRGSDHSCRRRHLGSDCAGAKGWTHDVTTIGDGCSVGSDAMDSPSVFSNYRQHVGSENSGAVDPTNRDSFMHGGEAHDKTFTHAYTFGRSVQVHSNLRMQAEEKGTANGRGNASGGSCDSRDMGNAPQRDFTLSAVNGGGSSHAVPQVNNEACDPSEVDKSSTSNEMLARFSADRNASTKSQIGSDHGNGYFKGDTKVTQQLLHDSRRKPGIEQFDNDLGTGQGGSKTEGGSKPYFDDQVAQMPERSGAGLALHCTRDHFDARGSEQRSDGLFVPIGDRGGASIRTLHLGNGDTTGISSLPFDPGFGADGLASGCYRARNILRSGSAPFLGLDEGFQDSELTRSEFAGTDAGRSFAQGDRAFQFAPGIGSPFGSGPSPGYAVSSVEGTSRPDPLMLLPAKTDRTEPKQPSDGAFVPVGDRGGASLRFHYHFGDSTIGLSSLSSDSGPVADGSGLRGGFPTSRRILRSGSVPCLSVDEGFQDSEPAQLQCQTSGFDAGRGFSECDRVFEFAPSIGPRFGFGLMPGGAVRPDPAIEGMSRTELLMLLSATAAQRSAEEQGISKEAEGKGEGKSPAAPEPKADSEAAAEPKADSEAAPGKGKSKGKAPPPPASAKGKGKAPPPPSTKGKDSGKGKGPAPPPKASQGDAQAKEAPVARAMPKTKPLSWRKIDAASEGTLWALNRSCMEDFQVEREQIEAIFSWAQPPKLDQQTGNAPKDKTKEKEQIKLTTKERVMGICIGLRCVKNLGSDGIRQAILDLDSNKLTAEATERLLMCDAKLRQPTVLPTTEELAAARAHVTSGLPDDALDEASRFIVAVHDIPHLRDRLHLHQFRLSFDENVASLRQDLALLRTALQQVRESQGFAVILMFVLKAGNILNDGTDRGNASGFRIDSLAALTLLKGNKGQAAATKGASTAPAGGAALSLVDYLVGVIEQQRPKLLEDVPRELKDVAEASRLELEEIERNAKEKRLELQKIAKSIGVVLRTEGDEGVAKQRQSITGDEEAAKERQSITNCADPGLAGASEFLGQTMCTLDCIEEEVGEVKKAYKEVSEFFGEQRQAKADQIPVHEWLGFVTRFLVEMQKALVAHRLRLERAKRAETAQAQKAIRGARKKTLNFAARQHRDRKNSGSFCGRRESIAPRLTVAKLGKDGEKLQSRQRRTMKGDRLQAASNACASPGSIDDALAMAVAAADKRYAGRSSELIARRRRRIKRRVSLKINKLMQEKCRRERARHLVLKYRKVKFTQVYDSDDDSEESSDREGDRIEAGAESRRHSVTAPVAPKTASRNSAPTASELEKAKQQQSRSSSNSRGLWGRLRLSLTEDKDGNVRRVARNSRREGLRRSPSAGNVRSRRSSEQLSDKTVHESMGGNTQNEQLPVEAYASLNAQAAYEEGLQRVPRLRQFRIQSASDIGRGRMSTEPVLPHAEPVNNDQQDEENAAEERSSAGRRRALVKPHPQRAEGEESRPERRPTEVGEIKHKLPRRLTWAPDAGVDTTAEKAEAPGAPELQSQEQQDDREDEAESRMVPAHREITRIMASLGMAVSNRRSEKRNTMPARVLPQVQTDSTDSESEKLTFGKSKSEPAAHAQSAADPPSTEATAAEELDGEEFRGDKEQLVSFRAEDPEGSSDESAGLRDVKPGNSLILHPLSWQEGSEHEISPRPRAVTWQETRRSTSAARLSRLVDTGPVQTRRFTVDSSMPATALSSRRRSDLGTMLEAVANLGEELRRGFAAPRASMAM